MPTKTKRLAAIARPVVRNAAGHTGKTEEAGFDKAARKIAGRGGRAETLRKKLVRTACKLTAKQIDLKMMNPDARDEVLRGNIKPKRRRPGKIATTRTQPGGTTAEV